MDSEADLDNLSSFSELDTSDLLPAWNQKGSGLTQISSEVDADA